MWEKLGAGKSMADCNYGVSIDHYCSLDHREEDRLQCREGLIGLSLSTHSLESCRNRGV